MGERRLTWTAYPFMAAQGHAELPSSVRQAPKTDSQPAPNAMLAPNSP